MALFFDRSWFEQRLAVLNLPRTALAAAAGLNEDELALIFKDQREVSAGEVAAFALMLGAPEAEVALRCGVTTRTGSGDSGRMAALERRVADLEARLEALSAMLTRPGR